MSLLDRIWYTLNDIVGAKTYAESQKSKYKGIIDVLQSKISNIENITYISDELKKDYDCMERNPHSAKGAISDTFQSKETTNRTDMERLCKSYQDALELIKEKLSEAKRQYEYWCDEVIREDREMVVYQAQYYEELARQQQEQGGA